MKNTSKTLGIIAILVLIAFSFASCDNGTTSGGNTQAPFEGKWVGLFALEQGWSEYSVEFTGNNVVLRAVHSDAVYKYFPGIFTFTNTTITIISEDEHIWRGWTTPYTLSGDTLTLHEGDVDDLWKGVFSKPQPSLTEFVTLTQANSVAQRWNPTTSFSVNDRLNIGVKGNNPGRNITNFVITFKDGNTVLYVDDSREFTANDGYSFTYFLGYWPLETGAGNYTVEVYVVDADGVQSNTMTAAFEVK